MTFIIPEGRIQNTIISKKGLQALREGAWVAGYNAALRELDNPLSNEQNIRLRSEVEARSSLAGMEQYLPNICNEADFISSFGSGWMEGYQAALLEQGITKTLYMTWELGHWSRPVAGPFEDLKQAEEAGIEWMKTKHSTYTCVEIGSPSEAKIQFESALKRPGEDIFSIIQNSDRQYRCRYGCLASAELGWMKEEWTEDIESLRKEAQEKYRYGLELRPEVFGRAWKKVQHQALNEMLEEV